VFPRNLNNMMIDLEYNELCSTEKTKTRGKKMEINWHTQFHKPGEIIPYHIIEESQKNKKQYDIVIKSIKGASSL
jgi:hypothetical protein